MTYRIDPKTRRIIVSDLTPSIAGILAKIAVLTQDVELSLRDIRDQSEKLLILQGLALKHIEEASTAEPDAEDVEKELKDMIPEVKD